MTQDEIIRMARDADKDFAIALIALEQITPFLERFAAIVAAHEREKQAEQEPVATHICNLWVDPITKEYVVDHCDHPIEELIPAYSTSQYLSKKPDYWLGYGLQAYTQKLFEGATPLYAAPQPVQQEPVCKRCNGTKIVPDGKMYSVDGFQLEVPIECVKDCPDCTAPVRTKDLTDDEIMDLVRDECVDMRWPSTPLFIARAVIAADREKNK